MNFLLDVNIGLGIWKSLTARGHDVVRAALAYPTASDADLLGRAVAEDRIIVTHDSDFSDLIFAHGLPAPPALLYLRCLPHEQPAMIGRIEDILEREGFEHHVVVVTNTQNRYRAFPEEHSQDA